MNKEQLEEYLNNKEKALKEDVMYYEEQLRNVDRREFKILDLSGYVLKIWKRR